MAGIPERCPDGGTCHHGCTTSCFRVATCGPLSDVFPNDEWPVDDRPRVSFDDVVRIITTTHHTEPVGPGFTCARCAQAARIVMTLIAARSTTPPGWHGGLIRDALDDDVVIVNATPPSSIDRTMFEHNGSLAWALSLCSDAAQTGMIHASVSAVEVARRLYPWLVAAGWVPPLGEPDVDVLTARLREAHGVT